MERISYLKFMYLMLIDERGILNNLLCFLKQYSDLRKLFKRPRYFALILFKGVSVVVVPS